MIKSTAEKRIENTNGKRNTEKFKVKILHMV